MTQRDSGTEVAAANRKRVPLLGCFVLYVFGTVALVVILGQMSSFLLWDCPWVFVLVTPPLAWGIVGRLHENGHASRQGCGAFVLATVGL